MSCGLCVKSLWHAHRPSSLILVVRTSIRLAQRAQNLTSNIHIGPCGLRQASATTAVDFDQHTCCRTAKPACGARLRVLERAPGPARRGKKLQQGGGSLLGRSRSHVSKRVSQPRAAGSQGCLAIAEQPRYCVDAVSTQRTNLRNCAQHARQPHKAGRTQGAARVGGSTISALAQFLCFLVLVKLCGDELKCSWAAAVTQDWARACTLQGAKSKKKDAEPAAPQDYVPPPPPMPGDDFTMVCAL